MSAESLDVVLFKDEGRRTGLEARLVRAARPTPDARQCLSLKRPDRGEDDELIVDGPLELVSLPVAAIHPLPPLLAARTRLRGLRALAIWPPAGEDAIVLLVDAERLT
jgi:hypothetical protein